MTVKDRKLPVIQKTFENDLLNVDGQPYLRDEEGLFQEIDKQTYDEKLGNREVITWDLGGVNGYK